MKIANWLRPRTATVEELREQLASAAKAHEDAVAAVVSAQQAFDDSSSDAAANAAANALSKARESARYAEEHVGRAKRLLDAAEAKRAAEERAALQAKHDALAVELFERDGIDADLVEREAAAWLAAVDVRAARHEHYARRAAKRQQLQIMSHALGNPPAIRDRNEQPFAFDVAKIVRDHLAGLPMGPVRDLAFSVANFFNPSGGRFG